MPSERALGAKLLALRFASLRIGGTFAVICFLEFAMRFGHVESNCEKVGKAAFCKVQEGSKREIVAANVANDWVGRKAIAWGSVPEADPFFGLQAKLRRSALVKRSLTHPSIRVG